jgi:PAS domain S-box-containing protein
MSPVGRVQSLPGGAGDTLMGCCAVAKDAGTRSFQRYIPAYAETILSSITDGFVAVDAAWRYTYINPRAEHLLQCSAQETLGRLIWDVYPETVGPPVQSILERARAEQRAESVEYFSERLKAWFLTTVYPTPDGGLAINFRDITAQKRIEAELRNSEARFRLIFEHAPVGIAFVDADGHLLHVNSNLCEILGYCREELLGRTLEDVTSLVDLEFDLDELGNTLHGDVQQCGGETRYVRKDGQVLWCNLTISVQREVDKAPKFFIAIIEDISSRKEADAVLGAAAHELRLPLSHIKGFVSSLRRTDMEWAADIRGDFLAEAEREADRMALLIEELLQRAQSSLEPTSRPQRVRTAPNALVLASLDRVRAELENRQVRIDVPADLPLIAVNGPAIERVVANLLHNASKYSPADTPIDVSARVVAGTLELYVDDHGPGVPIEDAERIFEPFYRRKTPTQATQSGTGLGLAICRSIITAHGGRIWSSRRRGGGARFTVALRLDPPTTACMSEPQLAMSGRTPVGTGVAS